MEIILALVITLAIETSIIMLLDFKNLRLFLLSSIINVVTNVTMNLILINVKTESLYYVILVNYEIGTVFLEPFLIWLFHKYKYTSILIYSFLANLASLLTGLLVNNLIHSTVEMTITIVVFLAIYLISFIVFAIMYCRYKTKKRE